MKILQITKYFFPAVSFGGPVQVTHNLSTNMVRLGHDVTVFSTDAYDIGSCLNLKDRFRMIDGAKVYYFHNFTRNHNFFISPEIVYALSKNASNFDIVHLHEYRTFQNMAFYFCNKTHLPYVLSPHGELEYLDESLDVFALRRIFENAFGKKLLRNASALFALTELEKAQMIKMCIPEEKIEIVPNGINISDYTDLPAKTSFKRNFDIDPSKLIILYLGRISSSKGVDFIMRAFAELVKKSKVNDCLLVIAGTDDGYLSEAKSLASHLEISESVLFTGMLSEKEKISAYVDSSVCTYLGQFEAFGIVTLEAAACGTPVIVSKGTPMAKIVNDGKFGFQVKYGDINELVDAMQSILSDSKLAKEMSRNGRRYVKDNFSWSVISAQIEAIYSKILQ
jgi:glycosyltransferase involved in cell wall biosynthesis